MMNVQSNEVTQQRMDLYRRLSRAHRYLYARDPERLLQPDVDALDVPGIVTRL